MTTGYAPKMAYPQPITLVDVRNRDRRMTTLSEMLKTSKLALSLRPNSQARRDAWYAHDILKERYTRMAKTHRL